MLWKDGVANAELQRHLGISVPREQGKEAALTLQDGQGDRWEMFLGRTEPYHGAETADVYLPKEHTTFHIPLFFISLPHG